MVRLKDIAEAAEVSVGTVSKVLNGTQGDQQFGEECVERIRDAAKKLGYVPNYHARSLQTGRARALGIALSSSGLHQEGWEHFWALMMRGIFERSRELGYHVVSVTTTEKDLHDPVDVGMQFLRESRIDALLVPPFDEVLNRDTGYDDAAGPVILIDQPQFAEMPGVDLDGAVGIRKTVEHLAELGHEKIAWVGPPESYNRTVAPRSQAFHDAAKKAGLQSKEILCPFASHPEKETLAQRLDISRRAFIEAEVIRNQVTGVVCFEESIALGIYAAAQELRISIPDDLSVIGFDDIFASTAWPPMTVVSHMLPELGRKAVEIAIDIIENKGKAEVENTQRKIDSRLIVRSSTAAPKK